MEIEEKKCWKTLQYLTGGVVISEEKGYKLEDASLEMLGSADKITIDKDNTTISFWSWRKAN